MAYSSKLNKIRRSKIQRLSPPIWQSTSSPKSHFLFRTTRREYKTTQSFRVLQSFVFALESLQTVVMIQSMSDGQLPLNVTSEDQERALCCAALCGDTLKVEALLQNGADVNTTNHPFSCTPLMCAASSGHRATVELLLAKKACVDMVDPRADTAFTAAAQNGHLDVMECLAAAGANINHTNAQSRTPIAYASLHGHAEVVEWLLAKNVDANQMDIYSQTLLHTCCHANIMKLLLLNKADPNRVTRSGVTALQYTIHKSFTARNASERMATLLLEHKANVDNVDSHGWTPLHRTAMHSSPAMATLLLANGADSTTTTVAGIHGLGGGETALELAQMRNDAGTTEVFTNYQSDPDLWVFNRQVVGYFPKVLRQQWATLACLWSVRLDDSANALTPLPIELLHSLLSFLWRVHVFE